MSVLYLNAPWSQRDKTSFETIVSEGVGHGYGLTSEMAALPSGTTVEVIRKDRRHRQAVGILNKVEKTGTKASYRNRYDGYIDELIPILFDNTIYA